MSKTVEELEIEVAFLSGRLIEVRSQLNAAEDYAEALFNEPCATCGACDDESEADVWPGDKDWDAVTAPTPRGESVMRDWPMPHKAKGVN